MAEHRPGEIDVHKVHPASVSGHPDDPDADIDTRMLLRIGIGLAVGTVISGALVLALYHVEKKRLDRSDPPMPVMAEARVARERTMKTPGDVPAPPEAAGPMLQKSPTAEMSALREAEDAALGSWGWADKNAGLARIPIERAMEIVAKDGVAPLAPPPAETTEEPK